MKRKRVSITLNENLLEETVRIKELLREETGISWTLSDIANVAIRDFVNKENLLNEIFKKRSRKEKGVKRNEST